jgi:HEAT repeat protein
MLSNAFEALKTYDWGSDRAVLAPIDEAVISTHDDEASRQELEASLAAVLSMPVSRDAKDYVCRKLMVIGTAASVPALARLLPEEEHSHMARFALARIPAPEAAAAMRDALASLDGELKVGVIGSLGACGDEASVPAIAALLVSSDQQIARSAALALGDIRNAAAAQALAAAKPADPEVMRAVVDGRLACAEMLLDSGDKSAAMAIYKPMLGADQPKQVRLAATRGMLACAGQKE